MSLRLLAGIGGGTRLDLAGHLATHGPLALPRRKGSHAFATKLLEQISLSGLTGRGGGGFPTGRKIAGLPGGRRRPHLVINAMEGEPAAQKDSVLACFAPHLILDGAEVLATIIDAAAITVAVARDNPAAVDSLTRAVEERRAHDRPPFPISVEVPPGRYVAGEESALVQWVDGGPAMPTFRPTKPAKLVVKGRPTLVDNAETVAQIALIARHGAEWFAGVGTAGGQGTTLVTISGTVEEPGVFEVRLGTPVSEVLALARPRGPIAGVLLGGYGGTFIGPGGLDAPFSADGLRPLGSSVGAGVIVVLGSSTCGLTESARITRWMANESAGQCGPCVFGLPAVASDLELLASGQGNARTVRQLRTRLDEITGRGACAHPDGVVRMVRSALAVFTADLSEHAGGRRCAGASAASVLALPPNGGELEWR